MMLPRSWAGAALTLLCLAAAPAARAQAVSDVPPVDYDRLNAAFVKRLFEPLANDGKEVRSAIPARRGGSDGRPGERPPRRPAQAVPPTRAAFATTAR